MSLSAHSARVVELADRLIGDLQDELQEEVARRKTKVPDTQLRAMLRLVQERRNNVVNDQLPPKHLRYRYLTREVTDTWPLGDDLANRIALFEEGYNSL